MEGVTTRSRSQGDKDEKEDDNMAATSKDIIDSRGKSNKKDKNLKDEDNSNQESDNWEDETEIAGVNAERYNHAAISSQHGPLTQHDQPRQPR